MFHSRSVWTHSSSLVRCQMSEYWFWQIIYSQLIKSSVRVSSLSSFLKHRTTARSRYLLFTYLTRFPHHVFPFMPSFLSRSNLTVEQSVVPFHSFFHLSLYHFTCLIKFQLKIFLTQLQHSSCQIMQKGEKKHIHLCWLCLF